MDMLETHHRFVAVAYRRYLDADQMLVLALNDLREVFPANRMPYRGTIGAPGSRIRRLYEDRDRALCRLQASFEEFKAAKARMAARSRPRPPRRIALLGYAGAFT